MRIHHSRPLGAAFALVLAALPLSAQRSAAQIQQDIEFARGLAASWGFTDMSEAVLARLEKEAASGPSADEVQLLKCDIYAIGAGRLSDRTKRDELLKKALTAYDEYIATHQNAANRTRAEASYVETAVTYGRSLSASLEESAGAELEAVKKELQDSLTKVISKAASLATPLLAESTRTEQQDRQLFELLMNRGALLLLLARSQDDGAFSFEQAKKVYEQVVDLAGETSSAGLRAFIGIGDVSLAMAQPSEAVDYYMFVSETAVPRDDAAWAAQVKELGPDEVQRRFALMQLATPGVLQALIAAGEAPKACAEGLRLLNVWNREGLDLLPPYGYQSLLGIVAALNEAGGFVGGDLKAGALEWFPSAEGLQAKFPQKRQQRSALDLALALAQQVNTENRGNTLGVRAQRLMAELIEQPGVDVSPEILMEAARGKLADRDFTGAVDSYKRVLKAIEGADPAVRTVQGPRVLNAIGRAYMGMDRPLEAALVFQEAVTKWLGDPEFDSLNSRGYMNAANVLKRAIKSDPLIDGLYASAEKAMQDHDASGAGEIFYQNAMKIYQDEKDYPKARAAFKEVPTDTASYEKALVYVGVCEFYIGRPQNDFDAATRIFEDYLTKYLQDPMHALGAAEMAKEAKRLEARATAEYFWGLAEFEKAKAGKGDWQRVVDRLAGYEDRFPLQASYSPAAMYRVILAQFQLGRPKEVEEVYRKMSERYPGNKFLANASLDIYQALEKDYERLKASKDEVDVAKAKEVLRQMARYLEVGNQNATTPAFDNLRRESKHWLDLGEYAKAEVLLVKLAEKFATGPNAADVQQYILPDLGEALFEQQKMKEAADVLEPLVVEKKATLETTVLLARALSGYAKQVTGEDGRQRVMRVVPGVGGAENFTKAEELFSKLLETVKGREGAWTRPWLDMKFDQIYCIYQHAKVDSKKLESAKQQLLLLQTEYEGDDLPNLKEADLRAKFNWLRAQMK